ncbi:hypothetical protein T492DRAFT_1071773, partial [Pavlovales sp. CCMP2436]
MTPSSVASRLARQSTWTPWALALLLPCVVGFAHHPGAGRLQPARLGSRAGATLLGLGLGLAAEPMPRPRPRPPVRMTAPSSPDVPDIGRLLNDCWDNRTSASATDELDRLMRSSADRLNALSSGLPPSPPTPSQRSAGPPAAGVSAPIDASTVALLDNRRRRLSGELEAKHATEIANALKMARLWPSPKRQLAELLTVKSYMSGSSALSRHYYAQVVDVHEALGAPERAKAVRRQFGIAEASAGAGPSTEQGANPEMAKLLDLQIGGGDDAW